MLFKDTKKLFSKRAKETLLSKKQLDGNNIRQPVGDSLFRARKYVVSFTVRMSNRNKTKKGCHMKLECSMVLQGFWVHILLIFSSWPSTSQPKAGLDL